MLKRAIFLDRDGVINENRPDYVKSWEEFAFLPDVFDPLRQLAKSDFGVVVVSNQSAIGRGFVRRETVDEINRHMSSVIAECGGRIDAIYVCPHRPEENCSCRKPRPGMLLAAAHDLSLDLSKSYLIGDAVSDVGAGNAVGCRPILVLTGRGESQQALLMEDGGRPVPVVLDLSEAVDLILCRTEEA